MVAKDKPACNSACLVFFSESKNRNKKTNPSGVRFAYRFLCLQTKTKRTMLLCDKVITIHILVEEMLKNILLLKNVKTVIIRQLWQHICVIEVS